MQVVDEGKMNRSGVRVVVIMRRVAVGRTAGGFGQAVGIRSTAARNGTYTDTR